METARALSDNLASLLRREHGALAEFLVALADFDRRRGWAELGHASIFAYLHRELRLSKAAAHYRKVAAELIQEDPAVVAPLRSGELCLTSIIEVARVVTAENWEAVLPRFELPDERRGDGDVQAALRACLRLRLRSRSRSSRRALHRREPARLRAHNLESARRIFGNAVMDRYAGKKARRRRAASARRELAVLLGLDAPPGAPRATSSCAPDGTRARPRRTRRCSSHRRHVWPLGSRSRRSGSGPRSRPPATPRPRPAAFNDRHGRATPLSPGADM